MATPTGMSLRTTHPTMTTTTDESVPELCPVHCDHKTCHLMLLVQQQQQSKEASSLREEEEHNKAAETAKASLWESAVTFYLPFIFQSLWGSFDILRSLLVSYAMQTFMPSPGGERTTAVAPSWLLFWESNKHLPHVPPVLVFLAVLTMTALAVHPDGLTWVILRAIRSAAWYLLESFTTCWAWVVPDVGATICTILALITFASLFFFVYLLHRTLRRRKPPAAAASQSPMATASPDKGRRKRRKKGAHQRTVGKSERDESRRNEVDRRTLSRATEEAPGTSTSRADNSSSSSSPERLLEESLIPLQQSAQLPVLEEHEPMASPPQDLPDLPRLRVESLSTVDTAMDISLDDNGSLASGRSTPIMVASPESAAALPRTTTPGVASSQSWKHRTPRLRKPTRHAASQEDQAATPGLKAFPAVSRWDALKPMHHSESDHVPRGNRKLSANTKEKAIRPTRQSKSSGKSSHQDNLTTVDAAGFVAGDVRVSSPPLFETKTNLWTDGLAVATPDGPMSMTSLLDSHFSSNFTPDRPTTLSSLNPHSPPFAPTNHAASPLALAVRPPPGLTRQSFDDLPLMESLQLPSSAGPPFTPTVPGLTLPSGSGPAFLRPCENPFANEDDDDQIAADLQELGGQMVGSILDF